MNIGTVMDEIATALGSIDGLRISTFVPGVVTPPMAIVGLPDEVSFDLTYGRSMDQVMIPVPVLLSRASERAATQTLAAYLSGAGAKSIKAAIEGGIYTACDDVTVRSASVSLITVGTVDYLAATFVAEVSGQGDS